MDMRQLKIGIRLAFTSVFVSASLCYTPRAAAGIPFNSTGACAGFFVEAERATIGKNTRSVRESFEAGMGRLEDSARGLSQTSEEMAIYFFDSGIWWWPEVKAGVNIDSSQIIARVSGLTYRALKRQDHRLGRGGRFAFVHTHPKGLESLSDAWVEATLGKLMAQFPYADVDSLKASARALFPLPSANDVGMAIDMSQKFKDRADFWIVSPERTISYRLRTTDVLGIAEYQIQIEKLQAQIANGFAPPGISAQDFAIEFINRTWPPTVKIETH
jgi:hypothetical protein